MSIPIEPHPSTHLRKTVIVAERDIWPTPDSVSVIAALVASIDGMVAVRARKGGEISSPLEEAALKLAGLTGRAFATFSPQGVGRAANYNRDYRLIEWAERVVAFFLPDSVMDGGTGHVVHAAYQKGVACEAWTLDDQGTLYQIASGDAEGLFLGEE